MAKELSQNISPAQKIEGREASDRKLEEEKKEMGPAEEKKEEEDKYSEVKEEKSGTDQSRGKKDGKSERFAEAWFHHRQRKGDRGEGKRQRDAHSGRDGRCQGSV